MISVLLLLLWDIMFSRWRAEAKTNLFVNNEHYDQAKLLVIFLLLFFGVLFSTMHQQIYPILNLIHNCILPLTHKYVNK